MKNITARECFERTHHAAHVWHEQFACTGFGLDDESKQIANGLDQLNAVNYFQLGVEKDVEVDLNSPLHDNKPDAPLILDSRQAYGDRVQNMQDQADMINAYLSGRKVTAVDVPIIFILVKAHRLGKMPDYGDTYDDIEGYLKIAREVIGDDMIEAATTKEYTEEKLRRSVSQSLMQTQVQEAGRAHYVQEYGNRPRHPYEVAQRQADEEDELPEVQHHQALHGRCGRPAQITVDNHQYTGPCIRDIGHLNKCQPATRR